MAKTEYLASFLKRHGLSIVLVIVSLMIAQPSWAQATDQKTVAGAMGLLAALLYAIPPWVTGLLIDFLIVRGGLKLWKAGATAVLAMVLGYPSIWFSFTAFVLPGGPESLPAWILCAVLLTLTLGAVKVVSYWVVNEKFPTKKTALMLFVSAIAMVAAAFLCLMFLKKPAA